MSKVFLLAGVLLLICWWALPAQDSGSSFKLTPPPVPCLKFFPGVQQFTITGIHYTMGELESEAGLNGKPVAYGFNANYAFSNKKTFLGAQNGANIFFSYMNVSMPFGLTEGDDNKIHTNAYSLGFNAVIDLVNGEKRDIAGEIISMKPTVALFFGDVINYFSLNMGPIYEMLGVNEDIKAKTLTANYSIGMGADFPLGFLISIVPYIRYTSSQVTMSMKVPELFNPTELYTQTYTSFYSYMDYGSDIDLRPFRNAPDWVISLGMAMAQIEGLKNGNRLITLSIKHEMGKHYSSTIIGPALH